MKSVGVIVGAVIVVGISAAVIYRRGSHREPAAAGAAAGKSLTEEQKDRIRGFWAAHRKGESLQREGRFEEASAEYRRALGFDPRHEGALYNLANCYIELGRFAEALDPLRKLVEVDPLSQRAHLQIGLVHSCPDAGEAFDLDIAEEALRRAFEINQEETGSLLRLAGVALVKGDEKRAVELYALANQSNFRAVEGYYVRAFVHWKRTRPDAACDLLRAALEQSRKPKVVAGVPGEGDTRPGSTLPPSTIEQKRLIAPFWAGLVERFPEGRVEAKDLATEFRRLEESLVTLRRRIDSR